MAGFYSARSETIPPLPWPNFAPPFPHLGADPTAKGPQAGWGIRELLRLVIDQTMRVESVFRDVDSDGIFHCPRVSYACRRGLRAALYPFRPQAKTMADHTLKRSLTTKPVTIQPPPLHAINGVAGSGFQSPGSQILHKTSLANAISIGFRAGV